MSVGFIFKQLDSDWIQAIENGSVISFLDSFGVNGFRTVVWIRNPYFWIKNP